MTLVSRMQLHGPNSPHQRGFLLSPARYKVGRWGRRAGKSVCAYDMAVGGHGPSLSARLGSQSPEWRGIVHGFDVLWIGRSHRQAEAIWKSEVKLGFLAAGGTVNDTDKVATLPGMGSLIVCSQDTDSINNARGLGDKIIGIIGDEVAHWDNAQSKYLEVLAPIMADNVAWLVLISTTVPGSWFNAVCQQIMDGEKGARWYHSHATAHDNPRISTEALNELIAEYPPNDTRLQQEVYANLTTGGGGVALPEYDPNVHERTFTVPRDWRWVAGMDWGYTSPGCVIFGACGPEDRVHWAREVTFQRQEPYDVGTQIGRVIQSEQWPVEWIAGDDQMWQQSQGSETVAEEVQRGLNDILQRQRVPLIAAAKGPGSRLTRKLALHSGLKYTRDQSGQVSEWGGPPWTFDPTGCPNLCRTIPELTLETRKIDGEDVALEVVKKDGTEHWFDGLTYCAISRTPNIRSRELPVPEDVHPGFGVTGKRRPRVMTPEYEVEELLEQLARQGTPHGGRYGGRQVF